MFCSLGPADRAHRAFAARCCCISAASPATEFPPTTAHANRALWHSGGHGGIQHPETTMDAARSKALDDAADLFRVIHAACPVLRAECDRHANVIAAERLADGWLDGARDIYRDLGR